MVLGPTGKEALPPYGTARRAAPSTPGNLTSMNSSRRTGTTSKVIVPSLLVLAAYMTIHAISLSGLGTDKLVLTAALITIAAYGIYYLYGRRRGVKGASYRDQK